MQDDLGVLNDLFVMPDILKKLGLEPEQLEGAIGDPGMRDLHIIRAADAMALLREANRFWE